MFRPASRAGASSARVGARVGMLSSPQKRFAWSRSERFSDFTFFRSLLKRRRRPERIVREQTGKVRWKPAPWTPWLWVK